MISPAIRAVTPRPLRASARRVMRSGWGRSAQGDTEWARWRLGRYERWGADQNETEILTPAAAFLAKSRWMPVDEDEGRFLRPNELWATADRRRRAPSRKRPRLNSSH